MGMRSSELSRASEAPRESGEGGKSWSVRLSLPGDGGSSPSGLRDLSLRIEALSVARDSLDSKAAGFLRIEAPGAAPDS